MFPGAMTEGPMMAADVVTDELTGARLRGGPYGRLPVAPDWLPEPERTFWAEVVEGYELPPDALTQLELACNALVRWREARQVLDEEGLTLPGRWGERLHPLVNVERDSRVAALRALRELDLEGVPLPAPRVR
jgi:phage terminase small subunit